MKTSIVVILAAGACACGRAAAEPPAAPAPWQATRIDGSWRDAPANTIIEEAARDAGLRPMFEGDTERLLDGARVTLLARRQPVAKLLRRVGELTDTDIVVVSGRLVVYEHGRVPAMLIVANELEAGLVSDDAQENKSRRRDCEWIDLTVGAVCAELSRGFGIEVTVTDDVRLRQDLVTVTGTDLSLEDAVKEVCRQLECPFGWIEGGVVIGRPVADAPKKVERVAVKVAPTGPKLRLCGEPLTWADLAALTRTRSGRDVILPAAQQAKPLGPLWAEGDAMDVMIARAMWEPTPLSAEITGASLALHPMGEEGSD